MPSTRSERRYSDVQITVKRSRLLSKRSRKVPVHILEGGALSNKEIAEPVRGSDKEE